MSRPELAVKGVAELEGRRFTVAEGGLRLGRSSSNDIHIADEELSRNHCLFEIAGEDGIRVTDLASANGTKVNGRSIGSETVDLRHGDVIELGSVEVIVVNPGEPLPERPVPKPEPAAEAVVAKPAADGKVDLGFGRRESPFKPRPADVGKRRSPIANILWLVVAAVGAFAAWLVIEDRLATAEAPVAAIGEDEIAESVTELRYEKLDGDSEKVFRYAMTLGADGTLRVELDDVPAEDRHIVKSQKLGDEARRRLDEILLDREFLELDRDYAGPETEPPAVKSRTVSVVYRRSVKAVSVVNAVEPDAFVRTCEKLEAFSKNELGIWALGQSRQQLLELAATAAATAAAKWGDREVEYGNVHAAVKAWRESIFYLETVNPKPPEFDGYKTSLAEAEGELEKRYREQRFKADRAINLADWETAKAELQILCEIVPDRDDPRYREASSKLVDVEKRMSKKGGR